MKNLKNFLLKKCGLTEDIKNELMNLYEHNTLEWICENLGVPYETSLHTRIENSLAVLRGEKNRNKDQSMNGSGVKIGSKRCKCKRIVEEGNYQVIGNKRVCVGCVFKTLAS